MSLALRVLGVAASAGFGLSLIWLLFRLLPVSPAEAVVAALDAPGWLFAVVISLTLSNLVVGALKWRVAADWLARRAERPSLFRMVELTTFGEFFGQLAPVQLSTLVVRWVFLGREIRASGYVARATVFEQTFDLILVIAGSVAAVAVIGLALGPPAGLAMLASLVVLSLLALRACLRTGASILGGLARRDIWRGVTGAASDGFEHAAAAPSTVLATLSLYSLLRLILVALRAMAVLAVFAPVTASWLVFVASPPVALLTTIPVAPAGLGVAEWSWSAVLVHGGAAASVAAVAALALRLTNIVALVVIVGAFLVVRWVEVGRAEPKGSGA